MKKLLSKLLGGGRRTVPALKPIENPDPDLRLRTAYFRMGQAIAARKFLVVIDESDPRGCDPERAALEPNGRARALIYSLAGYAAVRRFKGDPWEAVRIEGPASYDYAFRLAYELAGRDQKKTVELMNKAEAEADAMVAREWPVIDLAAKNLAYSNAPSAPPHCGHPLTPA
jgi:hypothetical protein